MAKGFIMGHLLRIRRECGLHREARSVPGNRARVNAGAHGPLDSRVGIDLTRVHFARMRNAVGLSFAASPAQQRAEDGACGQGAGARGHRAGSVAAAQCLR